MLDIIIYFWIASLFLWIFITLSPWFYNRRKISRFKNRKYQKKVSETLSQKKSTNEKIIILDKILHNILLDMWYKWTLWEILKQSPEYIHNIDKIWESHKIRNSLVHDLDNEYSEKFLHFKLAEFTKEIRMLLKNI